MSHEELKNINALSINIEKAIEESNFLELASLSEKLDKVVQLLTNNSSYRENISKEEIGALEQLLARVNKYRIETEIKFKDYTLKISKQTKMQNAYKQSRG